MLTHPRAAAARRTPPVPPPQPPEPGAGLIATLGAVEDEDHILVIGQDGPELMCALLRAGATQVTHRRSHERLDADSASLVIAAHVPSLDWLAAALPSIRRALVANGRLVGRFASQPINQQPVRRMLALHGFTAGRTGGAADRQIFSAELPSFGLLRCA